MELKDTISLMTSNDYKDRFLAEYMQLKIRYDKLKTMCKTWDEGNLSFVPTCSREMYDIQLEAMRKYLSCLEARSVKEGIELPPA
jgi:hypothetical protein